MQGGLGYDDRGTIIGAVFSLHLAKKRLVFQIDEETLKAALTIPVATKTTDEPSPYGLPRPPISLLPLLLPLPSHN
jgi:hypothetical protein